MRRSSNEVAKKKKSIARIIWFGFYSQKSRSLPKKKSKIYCRHLKRHNELAFFVRYFFRFDSLLFFCGLQLFINFLEPNGKHRVQFELCANVAIIRNRKKEKEKKREKFLTLNIIRFGQFNLINKCHCDLYACWRREREIRNWHRKAKTSNTEIDCHI